MDTTQVHICCIRDRRLCADPHVECLHALEVLKGGVSDGALMAIAHRKAAKAFEVDEVCITDRQVAPNVGGAGEGEAPAPRR